MGQKQNFSEKFKICIELEGNEFVLLESSLINIDRITTFFKNKETMAYYILKSANLNYSDSKIYIKGPAKRQLPIEFIGSDFRNVINIFNDDNEFINFIDDVALLDPVLLSQYGREYLNKIVSIGDPENKDELYKAYLSNPNIPITRIINFFDSISNYNLSDMTIEEMEQLKGGIIFDAMKEIRDYCSSYEQYRNLYCYIKGLSIYKSKVPEYKPEDISFFDEKFTQLVINLCDNVNIYNENIEKQKSMKEEAESYGKQLAFDAVLLEKQEKADKLYENLIERLEVKTALDDGLSRLGSEIGTRLSNKAIMDRRLGEEAHETARQIRKESLDNRLSKLGSEFGTRLSNKANIDQRLQSEVAEFKIAIGEELAKKALLEANAKDLGNQWYQEKKEEIKKDANEVAKKLRNQEEIKKEADKIAKKLSNQKNIITEANKVAKKMLKQTEIENEANEVAQELFKSEIDDFTLTYIGGTNPNEPEKNSKSNEEETTESENSFSNYLVNYLKRNVDHSDKDMEELMYYKSDDNGLHSGGLS